MKMKIIFVYTIDFCNINVYNEFVEEAQFTKSIYSKLVLLGIHCNFYVVLFEISIRAFNKDAIE